MNRSLTRIAMMTAGIMLAHQVAAKAFRDATFLTAWPATALPVMMVATATATVALVPIVSRLLDRFSPLAVVTAGFALSALGHAAEWALFDGSRWIAVAIYLHLSAAGAVLLPDSGRSFPNDSILRVRALRTAESTQPARWGALREASPRSASLQLFPPIPFFCCSQCFM